MSEWISNLAPIYFKHNNVHYRLNYIDVLEDPGKCQEFPLSFDVAKYATYGGKNHTIIGSNFNSDSSVLYVPYLPYNNGEELSETVCDFVEKFASDSLLRDIDLYIYRHINARGGRKIAIAATNLEKKDKLIHELKIKTLQLKPSPDRINECWYLISMEMGEYNEKNRFCEIQKTLLLPWDQKLNHGEDSINFAAVVHLSLSNLSGGFRAIDSRASGESGSSIKPEKLSFDSLEKMNEAIDWLIKSCRIFNGFSAIRVVVNYLKNNNKYDAFISSYGLQVFLEDFDEE